jgi:hypothetical protein
MSCLCRAKSLAVAEGKHLLLLWGQPTNRRPQTLTFRRALRNSYRVTAASRERRDQWLFRFPWEAPVVINYQVVGYSIQP